MGKLSIINIFIILIIYSKLSNINLLFAFSSLRIFSNSLKLFLQGFSKKKTFFIIVFPNFCQFCLKIMFCYELSQKCWKFFSESLSGKLWNFSFEMKLQNVTEHSKTPPVKVFYFPDHIFCSVSVPQRLLLFMLHRMQ